LAANDENDAETNGRYEGKEMIHVQIYLSHPRVAFVFMGLEVEKIIREVRFCLKMKAYRLAGTLIRLILSFLGDSFSSEVARVRVELTLRT
jgi:hypothetical protein